MELDCRCHQMHWRRAQQRGELARSGDDVRAGLEIGRVRCSAFILGVEGRVQGGKRDAARGTTLFDNADRLGDDGGECAKILHGV